LSFRASDSDEKSSAADRLGAEDLSLGRDDKVRFGRCR